MAGGGEHSPMLARPASRLYRTIATILRSGCGRFVDVRPRCPGARGSGRGGLRPALAPCARQGRTARRARRPHARLRRGPARPHRRAHLAHRPAGRAVLRHAHGPAHPAARRRADPAHREPHEGHPAPGHPAPAALGALGGPARPPGGGGRLYVGVMWGWHVPALYDAALRHPLVHALEHTFFMTAGVLYWWHLMSPIRSRARLTGIGPCSTCSRPSCSSASWASPSPSPPTRSTPSTRTTPYLCLSARAARRWPGRSWPSSSRSSWASRSPGSSSSPCRVRIRRAAGQALRIENAPVPCRRLGTGA